MAHFNGFEYLTFPDCFSSVTKEDVEACIARVAVEERTSLAVIWPKGGAK